MIADRRTKIVATIGPASRSPEVLAELIKAGLNVARLNFSHGTHEDHEKVLKTLRGLSQELQAPLTVLQDLQGPKIRIGKVQNNSIEVITGQKIIITTKSQLGDEKILSTDLLSLPRDVKVGATILLDDGNVEFRVESIKGDEVHCEVVVGGELKDHKGMNLPGVTLSVDCLTPKDLADLEFGLSRGVDYVALSFVRRPQDIQRLRSIIDGKKLSTKIVAKIEKTEALENLEEIVALSDAVMVARGDLAVEIGQSLLPGAQKTIIKLCNRLGKPVITATQMLESMIENPRPTRAEITDIANAVLDGTDAIMLSAETASGKYPVRCVQTMDEVTREVEKTYPTYYRMNLSDEFLSVAESIAESACLTAKKVKAQAIVCLTTSGKTAGLIARARPKARIIAVTHVFETLNRLELIWGIEGFPIEPYTDTDEVMKRLDELLVNYGLCQEGDKVVLTMGVPVMERGTTNSIKVYTIKARATALPPEKIPLRCRPHLK